jgi:hypothetical protein
MPIKVKALLKSVVLVMMLWLQVEVLAEEPLVHVYHNMATDKEMDFIKRRSRKEVKKVLYRMLL